MVALGEVFRCCLLKLASQFPSGMWHLTGCHALAHGPTTSMQIRGALAGLNVLVKKKSKDT